MIIIPSLLTATELRNDIYFCSVMEDDKLCEAILQHNEDGYISWEQSTRMDDN